MTERGKSQRRSKGAWGIVQKEGKDWFQRRQRRTFERRRRQRRTQQDDEKGIGTLMKKKVTNLA